MLFLQGARDIVSLGLLLIVSDIQGGFSRVCTICRKLAKELLYVEEI